MLIETLIKLFKRDLNALKREIDLYKDEKNLWLVTADISNCSGNLCLHLVGNLKHFIGATLGHSGYIRQRELEFSLKNVPKADLIQQVDDTIVIAVNTANVILAHRNPSFSPCRCCCFCSSSLTTRQCRFLHCIRHC